MKKNLITPILLVLVASFCVFAQKPKSKAPAEIVPKRMKFYDKVFGFYDPNLCLVANDNLFGFIDRNGKEVIPPMYGIRSVDPNKSGHIPASNRENGCGVIDTRNNIIIPFKYEDIENVGENFAVSLNGKTTLINSKQEAIFKGSYGAIKYLGKNLYAVLRNKKWLIINAKEEVLKELSYAQIMYNVGYGLTVVADKNEMYGLIDSLGKEIAPLKYTQISSFSEGLARVEFIDYQLKLRLHGFIDRTGKEVIKVKYKDLGTIFTGGLVPVYVKYKDSYSWGYMNKNEKMVIAPQFSAADIFSDGFARVSTKQNRVGYINKQGKFLGIYEDAGTYHHGLAQVTVKERIAFIDTKGRVVIETDPNAVRPKKEEPVAEEMSRPVEVDKPVEQDLAPPQDPTKSSDAVEVGLDKPQEEIFTVVEQKPSFIGGSVAFQEYTVKNLKFPTTAKRANISGVVYVEIVVTVDGNLETAKALNTVGFGCDEEAIRFIKSITKWQPAKVDGRAVYGKTTIPVSFRE